MKTLHFSIWLSNFDFDVQVNDTVHQEDSRWLPRKKKTNENKKKFASSFQTKQFWKLDKNMISLYFIAVINRSPFVFWIINFQFSLSWHFEKKIRVILLRKARKEEITYFLCFVHPIFSSFGFWYFGHFSCMIFFPVFFRLAHLALQNVNKDYVIFS